MHQVCNRAHQLVDIIPSPVSTAERAARLQITVPCCVVRKFYFSPLRIFYGVGVKVIVDMHTIHIVATQHVCDHIQCVLPCEWLARVHPLLVAIIAHDLGRGTADVVARLRCLWRCCPCSERVEPRM